MHKFLFYNKFIIRLNMFRAPFVLIIRRSNFIIQHLVSSHSVGGHTVWGTAHRVATYRENNLTNCRYHWGL